MTRRAYTSHRAICFVFHTIDLFATESMLLWWKLGDFPGTISLQGINFKLHCISPFWVSRGFREPGRLRNNDNDSKTLFMSVRELITINIVVQRIEDLPKEASGAGETKEVEWLVEEELK